MSNLPFISLFQLLFVLGLLACVCVSYAVPVLVAMPDGHGHYRFGLVIPPGVDVGDIVSGVGDIVSGMGDVLGSAYNWVSDKLG